MTTRERAYAKASEEYERRLKIAENASQGRKLIARAALQHAMTAKLAAENRARRG